MRQDIDCDVRVLRCRSGARGKDDGEKGQPGRKSESKIQTNSKTRDGNYTSWVVTVKRARSRCRSCSSMREAGKQDQPDRLCGKEMGDDGREGKDWLGGGHSELGGISLTATEERAGGRRRHPAARSTDSRRRHRDSGPSNELL